MPFTSVSVRRSESHGDGGKRVRRRRAEASHSQFALRRTGAGSKRVPTAARSRDLRDRQRWRDCRSPAVPASALQPAVVLPAAGPSYRDASGCPRRLRRTAAPAAAPPPASLSAISPMRSTSPAQAIEKCAGGISERIIKSAPCTVVITPWAAPGEAMCRSPARRR